MMLKILIKNFLNSIGYQLIRLPKNTVDTDKEDLLMGFSNKHIYKLKSDPLNAKLHYQYAIEAYENADYYLAFSELKTADFLFGESQDLSGLIETYRKSLPPISQMNHNQYFRFITLSEVINKRVQNESLSILDIGGGHGELAAFIPNFQYCLAEPKINSISGTNLPFPEKAFDYVISCHVIEHIPISERYAFLDELVSKAKKGVILLNPFKIKDTYVTERLKLFIKITDAEWAKEHLECELPELQFIQNYASNKRLKIKISPNGTLTTSIALEFMNYFAACANLHNKANDINIFFNTKYRGILDSKDYPTAYLIELENLN